MIGEDESEPKCAIMKMSLDAARESKRLAQPHTSCLGGWWKMNRNHGWLIWVSYSQKHYSAAGIVLGSHWVTGGCALRPPNTHFTGNGILLPLLKARLVGFQSCQLWVDLCLHVRGTSHHLEAPGNKASCFGWQRKGRADGDQAKPSILRAFRLIHCCCGLTPFGN